MVRARGQGESGSGWYGPGELVGREREVAELHRLLARHRLVTVAGAAGIGKSALAAVGAGSMPEAPWRRTVLLEWGRSGTDPDLPDGSSGRDDSGDASPSRDGGSPDAVPSSGDLTRETLRRLGMGENGDGELDRDGDLTPDRPQPLTRSAPAHIRLPIPLPISSPTLLILDGVDPVHGECVGLVQRLLMTVPSLRILVTSRRPLGLGDEAVLRPGPLAVDSPDSLPGGGPAVALFVRHARTRTPHALATDAELRTVAAICAVLDGNPLAVELAAHQLTRHPLGTLAELLVRGQCWLDGPDPGRPGKRSLRASIGAGYALCTPEERMVWARASVFAGAFAENTAVFLCAGSRVEPVRVPGCLARLSALGVLEPVEPPGGVRGPRYRMNRAAREFGTERLRAEGEFAVVAERRTAHCRRVAAVAESLWNSGDQTGAARVVLDEEADVRAAIRHAFSRSAHAEAALETVVHLWFWWMVYGRAGEGRAYVLRLLPLCDAAGPQVPRAQVLAAWLCAPDDPRTARMLLGRAWPTAVESGDDALIGRISHVQGVLALRAGDTRGAAEHFGAAADLVPPYAPGGPSGALSRAAVAFTLADADPRAALRAARRALATPGVRDDAWASLVARYARALVDHRLGRTARAWRRAHRALAGLDAGLPEPYGSVALRRLLVQVERGRPGAAWTAAISAGRRKG
ncbi:hypothetical protein AB0O01_34585 [Streptomyces sp. NPDC093252]|uniref:hypothetical protein n=1 Tax=Streptomyces sp. NPDC093252 TaxID=3154980 RepID=UPI00342B7422